MRTILGIAIFTIIVFLVALMAGADFRAPTTKTDEAFQFALMWTVRAMGGLAAVSAALGMLFIAATHGPIERQLALVLPLLAGLLVFDSNWALAIALGGVAIAWLWRDTLGRKP